ncbi:MAG TPA: hypothetical protein VNE83_06485 [Terriglobales bacterium]|nr:hypothetical protein [Terriglobales bacterium]
MRLLRSLPFRRTLLPAALATVALCAGLAVSAVAADGPAAPAQPAARAADSRAATAPDPAGATGPIHTRAIDASHPAAAAPAPAAKWYDNFTLSGTVFFDYAYYAKTGFGPQFLTQMNQEGPGNNGFNSFDLNRTYLNFIFNPNGAIMARVTPNIYRQVDGSTASQAYGSNGQIGASNNGNLGFRLKYAYVQFNHPFAGSGTFGKDVVAIGQTTEPLVDWEEALFAYRYIALTPWNYLSLSSTYVGAHVHGPVMANGREILDYDLGVFNDTSFHHIETTKQKSYMGRLTWYPAGTSADRTGFGLTAFDDRYGTNNNIFAGIASFQSTDKNYELAGEVDLGQNAFSASNLFSGVGPTSTGAFANWNTNVVSSVFSGETRQRGYDVFGHARLGSSPATFVFLFQNFQPNIHVASDPLDFDRLVLGVSFKVNKNLDMAITSQNILYTQAQETFNGQAGAVPTNTNAIILAGQYNF